MQRKPSAAEHLPFSASPSVPAGEVSPYDEMYFAKSYEDLLATAIINKARGKAVQKR